MNTYALVLGLILTFCSESYSKKIDIKVIHTVECTSEGMSSIEFYDRTKRESRKFKDTLMTTADRIKEALDQSRSEKRLQELKIYDSLAKRLANAESDHTSRHSAFSTADSHSEMTRAAIRSVDIEQTASQKSESKARATGISGFFKGITVGLDASDSDSSSSSQSKHTHKEEDLSGERAIARSRDRSSQLSGEESTSTSADRSLSSTKSRDNLSEIQDSISRAKMMERDLMTTKQYITEVEDMHEKEKRIIKEYQLDRFQQWRRYTKTIIIDGEHQTQETFRYVHDSFDEITVEELQNCALRYLNNYILAGSGMSTEVPTVINEFSVEIPDFVEDAPRDIVVMWSGSIDKIPVGWLLCDGSNGTPDLRSKFIIGADKHRGLDVDRIGGSNAKRLTTNELPSHSHIANNDYHTHNMGASGSHKHDIDYNGAHSHNLDLEQMRVDSGMGSILNVHDGGFVEFMVDWNSHEPFIFNGRNLKTDEVSSHKHTMSSGGDHTHTMSTEGHTHTITSTGAGQSFDNRPAFYSLAFIMKKD